MAFVFGDPIHTSDFSAPAVAGLFVPPSMAPLLPLHDSGGHARPLTPGPARAARPSAAKVAPSASSRDAALMKWERLAGLHAGSSACLSAALDKGDTDDFVKDSFSMKSAATLHKRANSLLSYYSWAVTSCTSQPYFPVDDAKAYSYLLHLKVSGSGALAGDAFLQAVRFTNAFFEVKIADPLSRRTIGFSDAMLVTKRETVRRDPLTVLQVLALEETVLDDGCLNVDRHAAAACLFAAMGRLRGADLIKAYKLKFDISPIGVGYIDASVKNSKTAKKAKQKSELLPVAAVVVPLCVNGNWAEVWEKLRQQDGLGPDSPCLPRPGDDAWDGTPLDAAEIGSWLRLLLSQKHQLSGNVGSHSLKATCLSWAAKGGVDGELRKQLGYHVGKKEVTMNVYARDAMAPCLDALAKVITSITTDDFRPDDPRSTRGAVVGLTLPSAPAASSSTSPVAPAAVVEPSSESDLSSEADTDSEDDPAPIEEAPVSYDDYTIWMHVKFGTVHLADSGIADGVGTMFCGRTINANYQETARPPPHHRLCCKCEAKVK